MIMSLFNKNWYALRAGGRRRPLVKKTRLRVESLEGRALPAVGLASTAHSLTAKSPQPVIARVAPQVAAAVESITVKVDVRAAVGGAVGQAVPEAAKKLLSGPAIAGSRNGQASDGVDVAKEAAGTIGGAAGAVAVGAEIGALPVTAIFGGGGAGAAAVSAATGGVAAAGGVGLVVGTVADAGASAAISAISDASGTGDEHAVDSIGAVLQEVTELLFGNEYGEEGIISLFLQYGLPDSEGEGGAGTEGGAESGPNAEEEAEEGAEDSAKDSDDEEDGEEDEEEDGKEDEEDDDEEDGAAPATDSEDDDKDTSDDTDDSQGTPNPLDEQSRGPILAAVTDGRLGGQEAKNEERGLAVHAGGGVTTPSEGDPAGTLTLAGQLGGALGTVIDRQQLDQVGRAVGAKDGSHESEPPGDDSNQASIDEGQVDGAVMIFTQVSLKYPAIESVGGSGGPIVTGGGR
jgi:hypothetical protein